MRNTSAILIYIDLAKALNAGIKFWTSQNGVVLSEGDENGFLRPEFFSKVEATDGKDVPGYDGELWEPGAVPHIIEKQPPQITKGDVPATRLDDVTQNVTEVEPTAEEMRVAEDITPSSAG
jgi:hypothetical protein